MFGPALTHPNLDINDDIKSHIVTLSNNDMKVYLNAEQPSITRSGIKNVNVLEKVVGHIGITMQDDNGTDIIIFTGAQHNVNGNNEDNIRPNTFYGFPAPETVLFCALCNHSPCKWVIYGNGIKGRCNTIYTIETVRLYTMTWKDHLFQVILFVNMPIVLLYL